MSSLNYVKIVVCSFIGYMNCRYQKTVNIYEKTRERLIDNGIDTPTSEQITYSMGGLMNRYNKPVSYTHLDVYKRQVCGRWSTSSISTSTS